MKRRILGPQGQKLGINIKDQSCVHNYINWASLTSMGRRATFK
ncbi:hypothetical protein LINGRAHAP2_LOCUS6083, partial [Linum grandiflorum]